RALGLDRSVGAGGHRDAFARSDVDVGRGRAVDAFRGDRGVARAGVEARDAATAEVGDHRERVGLTAAVVDLEARARADVDLAAAELPRGDAHRRVELLVELVERDVRTVVAAVRLAQRPGRRVERRRIAAILGVDLRSAVRLLDDVIRWVAVLGGA